MNYKSWESLKDVAFIKSLYFNLKAFDLKTAVKCPVLIGKHTQIHHLKRGCIELPDKISTGIIKIGIRGTYGTGIPGGYTKSDKYC